MNILNNPYGTHPLLQAVKNLFSKLRQNPEIYPIKYYKKNHRNKRNMKATMEK